MIASLTNAIRRYFSGRDSEFVFRSADAPSPQSPPDSIDVYLHVPFCRNVCPYCPYYKVRYEAALAAPFTNALKVEIRLLRRDMPSVRAGSVYVGGGTPTLLGDGLPEVLDCVRTAFAPSGPVAIEVNPADLDDALVALLRSCGVDMVSLGVQSFQDANLRLIGRSYRGDILQERVRRAVEGGFGLVNLDLMFALPGQNLAGLGRDLDLAMASGADQVTLYPLFTFPYTSVGQLRRLRRVGMPSISQRRLHYRRLHDKLTAAGWRRVSVWSFMRPGYQSAEGRKYSSVTRDMYVGLGPGAATHLPGEFAFNTFSLEAYQRRLTEGRLATALAMPMNNAMERYYWLYWRLYETAVPTAEMAERFDGDARATGLMRWLCRLRMIRRTGQTWRLTERGAFWVHWAQNHFILNYIDKVWRRAAAEPFPDRIEL